MKALIISSLLFFSLRAMSAEVRETQEAVCPALKSQLTRVDKPREVASDEKPAAVESTKALSK